MYNLKKQTESGGNIELSTTSYGRVEKASRFYMI